MTWVSDNPLVAKLPTILVPKLQLGDGVVFEAPLRHLPEGQRSFGAEAPERIDVSRACRRETRQFAHRHCQARARCLSTAAT